jgi:hypothetical protein
MGTGYETVLAPDILRMEYDQPGRDHHTKRLMLETTFDTTKQKENTLYPFEYRIRERFFVEEKESFGFL